jgi:hypothetical protein
VDTPQATELEQNANADAGAVDEGTSVPDGDSWIGTVELALK